MNSLLEFITQTKGVEYLLAIAFLLCFVVIWLLIHRRVEGSLIRRIVPVIVIVFALVGVISMRVTSGLETETIPPKEETPLLSSPVLVEMYGPAYFDHELHQRIVAQRVNDESQPLALNPNVNSFVIANYASQSVQDCTFCHHHSGDRFPNCEECHFNGINSDDLSKPSLAHVYHLRCISCHKESQSGPTDCTGCHNMANVPPLSIAHPLTAGEDCLQCHGDGIAGVPALPSDHTSVTNSVCQLCHMPNLEASAISTQKVPHGFAGRENACLLCHGTGIGVAAKVPLDHAGRTNEICQLCHNNGQETIIE